MKRIVFNFVIVAMILVFTVSSCEKDIPVTSVRLLHQIALTLVVGDEESLIDDMVVYPENAKMSLKWKTDNPSVAIVANGVVTALSVGSATIIITSKNGKQMCICPVTVIDSTPKQMYITAKQSNSETAIYMGGTGTATIDWGDGTDVETHELNQRIGRKYSHFYSDESPFYTITIIGANVRYFALDYNQPITNLDVSNNPALTRFGFANNQLTNLDVSNNPILAYLDCVGNQLTSLDLSNNLKLLELWCSRNQLTSLDLSNNSMLTFLDCSSNQLSSSALNNLFSTLHSNSIIHSSRENRKIISVENNPGTYECDASIATKKGWTVYKIKEE